MAVSTFKYATSTDLQRIFSRIGDYDTKIAIYNWNLVFTHGGFSLYEAYDTGHIVDFFVDGEDLKSQLLTENYTDSTANTDEAVDLIETQIDVTDGSQFNYGDIIRIDSEKMIVTNISSNKLTVQRGALDTTTATHNTGVDIYIGISWTEIGQWFYTKADDHILYYVDNGTDPNDLQTEGGSDFTTLIDDVLENASQELNTLLDARYPIPIPKAFLYSSDPANDTPQYDPIIVRTTCYLAAANLIRSTDPLSEQADKFYSLVTNIDNNGLIDEINSGKRKLNFEIDTSDKSGNIVEITRTGTMHCIETYGTYTGELYDRIQIICTTGGVYGDAKVSIKTYGDDKLFGTVLTDEIITGRLQHIHGGLYARFQGNSMSVGDRWDIEVRSAGLVNTNSPIKNIRIKRGKY